MFSSAMVPTLKVVLVVLASVAVHAFDNKEFKKCHDLGFCLRNRAMKDKEDNAEFVIKKGSVEAVGSDLVKATLHSTATPEGELALTVQILSSPHNTLRLRVDEAKPENKRFETPYVLEEGEISAAEVTLEAGEDKATITSGTASCVISYSPFKAEFFRDGELVLVANAKGMFLFEHYRAKTGEEDAALGLWEETFKGHTDSKPKGPASWGTDITFVGAEHVYGIPEHATSLALKPTRVESGEYTEPYRMYNLDVFEYKLDSPFGLYGSIPFMMGHSAKGTVGMFLLNSAEMYIDVDAPEDSSTSTHWFAESGMIDMFVFLGPTPKDIVTDYTTLTGKPYLPAQFALTYNQCRWNYRDEHDVATVDARFDEHDIPYDTLWLDIEHTDGKKYFTWDSKLFPTPKDMQEKLAVKSRKMVTIVDPHIKRDGGYHLHDKATKESLYVKTTDNKDFEGHCWPGASSYMDFMKEDSRKAYADEYVRYEGATDSLHTWNDMNEPSVFNGPEMTMQKDLLHNDGAVEHRDMHNIYGMLHHVSSHNGLMERMKTKRPFILTRSFFAGSQRYAAVWTGDNMAQWDHLEAAQPMLLTLGLSGLPHVGSDIGGFFGNPDTELLTRWYQVGAYHPFMRAHAHIDTKRREPYLFGEPHTSRIRDAVRARYRLLPYWYTVARESNVTGVPMMRAMFMEFPSDLGTFAMEDQFLIGANVLVKPIGKAGIDRTTVYLPGQQGWFDFDTGARVTPGSNNVADVSAPIDKLPVFQRGGSVVPKRERARRSSSLMARDPFTLVVAADDKGKAVGDLYLDDGESYGFREGMFMHRQFTLAEKVLSSASIATPGAAWHGAEGLMVERIIFRGVKPPTKVTKVENGLSSDLDFTVDHDGQVIVRKPVAAVNNDWTITLA